MNARPQFSIKDVLWLTALIGIGTGWYLDHQAAAVCQQADWDAVSIIDYGLQADKHYLKEFQKKLDELKRQP